MNQKDKSNLEDEILALTKVLANLLSLQTNGNLEKSQEYLKEIDHLIQNIQLFR